VSRSPANRSPADKQQHATTTGQRQRSATARGCSCTYTHCRDKYLLPFRTTQPHDHLATSSTHRCRRPCATPVIHIRLYTTSRNCCTSTTHDSYSMGLMQYLAPVTVCTPVGDSKRAVTRASVESLGRTVMMLLMLLPSCRRAASGSVSVRQPMHLLLLGTRGKKCLATAYGVLCKRKCVPDK
jgi:hypothetical protein